ncbi:unnamed protein product [Dovyalis caffra]|uniref:Uncharacterized protein n=1 Tax=Dovyalis caffra TaxID=77055 RepID=A0AAV1RWK1_9ROSI|nr:unnamed protein product [Dovyalis caffra]
MEICKESRQWPQAGQPCIEYSLIDAIRIPITDQTSHIPRTLYWIKESANRESSLQGKEVNNNAYISNKGVMVGLLSKKNPNS